MFIITHLIAGLIIGKITNNYILAVAVSLLIDLDHLIPYVKHKVLFNWKKFGQTITNPKGPYGNQRNYFHSIFGFVILCSVALIINKKFGLVITLSFFSHILLDLLDGHCIIIS